jgi:hypothetical protein
MAASETAAQTTASNESERRMGDGSKAANREGRRPPDSPVIADGDDHPNIAIRSEPRS